MLNESQTEQEKRAAARKRASVTPLTFSPLWFQHWDEQMAEVMEKKRPKAQGGIKPHADTFAILMREKHSA